MKPFILDLSDSKSSIVSNDVWLRCTIPIETDYVKVIGTISFQKVWFDIQFYEAFSDHISILDLSELKSSSSYDTLHLGLNGGFNKKFKEIILPNGLKTMPMIRNLSELRKIVALGLTTFDNEVETDYYCRPNLSGCPKLEEIILGSNIERLTIRNSSLKKITIPNTNGLLKLEPYDLAYNEELEEVQIPDDMIALPTRVFEGCKQLRTITGGDGIETIGFGAFGGCTSLFNVPFRIGLLREDQFVSYHDWMRYEPIDHRTSYRYRGDCSNCPKGTWSEGKHEWVAGCSTNSRHFSRQYCRDDEQQKWKPYKRGVVLRNGNILCFDDFKYYTSELTRIGFIYYRYSAEKMHKYVEFISPSITFTSDGNQVKINYNPQGTIAEGLTFPDNSLAKMIDLYYEDISYEAILDEERQIVEGLDINAIIESYGTVFSHEYFKMNSDTDGERYSLDRDANYTDAYLINLLPPIHMQYDDRTCCVKIPDYVENPFNKKYDFGRCYNTYGNTKEDDVFYTDAERLIKDFHASEKIKKEDEEIRKAAREKYNRKEHIDYLVNCRISEIMNIKLEIESRFHLRHAEM